ncbi:hypothetical protein [Candidatus Poriferisodalis sp.]|uniref:HORMA-1 domain-containing protein n=1 Tax=Candidatus Poriferisodalis sp. TaxID=3101277 RepID=UPI003B020E8D
MSMTTTHTNTFTIANARYVTSKIKTDLKLLQKTYGSPTDAGIEAFGEEAAQLLNRGYLGTVTYGYRRNGCWVLALEYTARNDGTLAADDRAGGIPRGVDIAGAQFYSYLTYSPKWKSLPASERSRIKDSLPTSRTGAPQPGTSGGYWSSDRNYSSNGTGVARGAFRPL